MEKLSLLSLALVHDYASNIGLLLHVKRVLRSCSFGQRNWWFVFNFERRLHGGPTRSRAFFFTVHRHSLILTRMWSFAAQVEQVGVVVFSPESDTGIQGGGSAIEGDVVGVVVGIVVGIAVIGAIIYACTKGKSNTASGSPAGII